MDESIDMYSCMTTFVILPIIMWFVMHVIDVCGFVYIPIVLVART